jgi:hypothetical protein
MQAAISTVAHWLERAVSTLPISVGEVEQQDRGTEHQQCRLADQIAQAGGGPIVGRSRCRDTAVRLLGVDLLRRDEP